MDTAWVGLDRDDNDPNRLWSSVVAAIAGCPSVPHSSRLHDRRAWPHRAQPEFIAELADSLQSLPQRIRLILDDVHELVDPQVLHGVQTFIRVKPATVQLVLSSRLDPPLSLPRLRLAGRLWELRAAQMSFTPHQAAALLEKAGLRVSPAEVEVLCARTGGWAAGLRLAAYGMAESGDREAFLAQFSGDDRSVADYLVGEILSGLPADVQEFMRVICISDPVPVGLAAELSEREEAGSILDQLEHQTSLVTATGPRREAYRVQELLRTHLLADLRRQGMKRVAGLHAVAARWWAGQHQPVRALEHAVQSRDTCAVDGPATPLAGSADPRREPRTAATGAGRCRRSGHGGRSLAFRGLSADQRRGRRACGRAGRPAPRAAVVACARKAWTSWCSVPSPSSSVPTQTARPGPRSRKPTICPPNRSWRRSPG